MTNIQRFCVSDGPGIRTTVFLKGCNLHCPWCSNPENISLKKQYYYNEAKCIKKNGSCSLLKDCIILTDKEKLLQADPDKEQYHCPIHAIGVYGKSYRAEELYQELMKDRLYWGSDGGVTFSGGEPLLQIKELAELLTMLSADGVHLTAETALQVREELAETAGDHFDLFYVDIKILDQERSRRILGGNPEAYLRNLELLHQRKKKVIFRFPCSAEYTSDEQNIHAVIELLQKYKQYPVEIFRLHRLGSSKYKALGMTEADYQPVGDRRLEELAATMAAAGIQVTIISV